MVTSMKTGLAALALAICSAASGQVLISDGAASACGGVLYDTSGEGGAGYSPNENFTLTLCPEDGTNVFLEWINFELDVTSSFIFIPGRTL